MVLLSPGDVVGLLLLMTGQFRRESVKEKCYNWKSNITGASQQKLKIHTNHFRWS